MKLFFRIFILSLLLTSCFSMGNPDIKNPQNFSRIQRGYTSKSQLVQMFGEPQVRSRTATGVEKWGYNYVESEIDGETFIPIYGIFAGGGKSNTNTLEIEFDYRGIVSNYTTTQSQYNFKNFGGSR